MTETRTTGGGRSEPPLRALTVLTYYRPHWTGLTRFAQRIAEGLARSGVEVSVLTSRYDRSLAPEEVLDGVRVHRLATAGRLSRTVVMPGFPAALWREARRHDVVHLHSPMAEAGLVAAVCRLTGTPLVVTHQGDVVMPEGAVNQALQTGMRAMLATTFRGADRVVTHNDDYLRHSLTAVAGPRATAIEPPVPFRPPPEGAAAKFRADHGLHDAPVVGFAGRWVEEKGFDVLLRAAPLVLAAVPEARFVFAGERHVAYERFSETCLPLVEALGPAFVDVGLLVDEADLGAFYAACDVFVLPSRTDCHASVQVEAMLCGTPVVASDIPGARSVVAGTGAGVLVPPSDPAPLAAAVVDVLRDPGRFDAPLAGVADHHDPERAVAAYHDLLAEVARSPRHRTNRTNRTNRTGGKIGRQGDRFAPRFGGSPATGVDGLVRADPDGLVGADLDTAYRRRVRWAVDRLALQPGDVVLDAGCGLGNVSFVLERVAPDAHLVGVELDPARIVAGRATGVRSPLVRSDVGRLPFPDAVFDAVICSEVLEHVADDDAVAGELLRVLRPGGRLVVTVPHADHPWTWDPLNRLLVDLGRSPVRRGLLAGAWTDHRRLYRPAALEALLVAAGFEVDEVDEQTSVTVPFAHLAFYGLGRLAVQAGVVPAAGAPGGRPSPRPVRAVVDRLDRRDRTRAEGASRFVSLVAAARRPG